MLQSEEHSLEPFDPEIERTLLRRRRENQTQIQVTEILEEQQEEKMPDPVPLLRDLWIPRDHGIPGEMVQPIIQANNFELKPALINMVQQSRFGGTALEDPHEHIRTFLEYCNTLKQNGVTPSAIRLSLFSILLEGWSKSMATLIA
jgi:hypothetical protein